MSRNNTTWNNLTQISRLSIVKLDGTEMDSNLISIFFLFINDSYEGETSIYQTTQNHIMELVMLIILVNVRTSNITHIHEQKCLTIASFTDDDSAVIKTSVFLRQVYTSHRNTNELINLIENYDSTSTLTQGQRTFLL
jgi:uncharacterized membrane protein